VWIPLVISVSQPRCTIDLDWRQIDGEVDVWLKKNTVDALLFAFWRQASTALSA
jgi:hypothetical protein